MDEKKKRKLFNKIMCRIFIIFLISFSVLYASEASGYYEFEQHKRVELTEEKIKQFETDVKEGKNINITDYISEKDISYENGASTIGITLSNQIGNIVQNGLDATFNFLGKLFQ